MPNENKNFAGKIKMVSSSPHGMPEGVVLNNGTFIKMPPHSLVKPKGIKVGASISGSGELIATKPNKVYHHVLAKVENHVVSNDQGTAEEKDELRRKHKIQVDAQPKEYAEYKNVVVRGKVFSLAVRPNGEVDRMMLEDGTAVHLPKELLIDYKKVKRGDTLSITGKGQKFKNLSFLRATSINLPKASPLNKP